MIALLAVIAVQLTLIIVLLARAVRILRNADRGGSLAISTDSNKPIRTTVDG